jgi:hypothetical protein
MQGMGRLLRMAAAALACANALALVPCARASAPAPLPPDFFGVNLNRVLFDDHDPAHTAPLAAARAVGITRGRIDFPWGAVQPNGPDSADYRWTDAAVAALAAQGIQAAPMLGYSAGWAASSQGDDKTPPRRLSDYSRFAMLMVRRYGPGGSFWQARPDLPYLPVGRWEVWNEPNLPPAFWKTGRDPALYGRLYLAARAVIRAVDPRARVIVGGLHSSDIAFVTDMYRADPGLHGNVDGLGIHPYATTVQVVLAAVRGFRAALDAAGEASVPMEVTEVGWQREGNTNLTVSEQTRAGYLASVVDILARSDCGIDALEPYAWETGERDPANGEDWYGIWSPSAGLLPTGQAYAATIARYSNAAARAAARSSQLLRICHPPKLHLTMRTRGRLLGIRAKEIKHPHLVVKVSGRRLTTRSARRSSHARGYSYFALVRSATRVAVQATARGFATYRATFKIVRHGRSFRLKRVRARHPAPNVPVPDQPPDDPSAPVAGQPSGSPPPHSDDPPCALPAATSASGTVLPTLPAPTAPVAACSQPGVNLTG